MLERRREGEEKRERGEYREKESIEKEINGKMSGACPYLYSIRFTKVKY